MEELRQDLKKFMFDRNLKLKDAAILFDLSVGTISKFINGKQNLNQRNEYRVRQLINNLNQYAKTTKFEQEKSVHAFLRKASAKQ